MVHGVDESPQYAEASVHARLCPDPHHRSFGIQQQQNKTEITHKAQKCS